VAHKPCTFPCIVLAHTAKHGPTQQLASAPYIGLPSCVMLELQNFLLAHQTSSICNVSITHALRMPQPEQHLTAGRTLVCPARVHCQWTLLATTSVAAAAVTSGAVQTDMNPRWDVSIPTSESITAQLKILEGAEPVQSLNGKFYSYTGEELPW
jgi:hypothetical protein